MAVVFVVVLPRIVDYGAVAAALSTLTAVQLALLGATTALAYVANAVPSRVLIPALSWPHAVGADLAGRAVVSTIPGPTDVATRFVLYRQWSIPADTATAGIVFNAFFETLSDLVLPLIATIGIVVAGRAPRPQVVVLAVVGVIVLVVAMALLVAIVRSESLARRLGRALDAVARRRVAPRSPTAAVRDRRGRAAGPGAIARDPVAARGPRVRGGRARAPRLVPGPRGLAVVGRRDLGGAAAVRGPDDHGRGRAPLAHPDHARARSASASSRSSACSRPWPATG